MMNTLTILRLTPYLSRRLLPMASNGASRLLLKSFASSRLREKDSADEHHGAFVKSLDTLIQDLGGDPSPNETTQNDGKGSVSGKESQGTGKKDSEKSIDSTSGSPTSETKPAKDTSESNNPSNADSSDENALPTVAVDEEEAVPVRVHHFDTQKMVTNLKYAGSTRGQAEVIMKTVRDMLDQQVEEVQERNVPNSVAANEAYLFEAASSELRNELQAARLVLANQLRGGLARLQREVEILQHEAGEMTTLLRADMDMDINDRKNVARTEENAISLKLQELNNKISVRLASDLKSEIEDLRWQITRRGIVAVVFVAVVILYVARTYGQDVGRPYKDTMKEETRGGEYNVPILSPSISGDDQPEDIVVYDLEPEPTTENQRG